MLVTYQPFILVLIINQVIINTKNQLKTNYFMKKLLIAGLFLAGFLTGKDANAQQGGLLFFEGNNATQNVLNTSFLDNPSRGRVSPNDEARSLLFQYFRVGAVITVYDDKNFSKSDDYCVIRIKAYATTRYVVASFERSYEDDYVQVTYYRKNGLDGKVSSCSVE